MKRLLLLLLISSQLLALNINSYIDKKLKPIQFEVQENLKNKVLSYLNNRMEQTFDLSVSIDINTNGLKKDLEIEDIKDVDRKVLLPGLEIEKSLEKDIVRNIQIDQRLVIQNITAINLNILTPKKILESRLKNLKNDLTNYFSNIGISNIGIQNTLSPLLMSKIVKVKPKKSQKTNLMIIAFCFLSLIFILFMMLKSLKSSFTEFSAKINNSIKNLSEGLSFNIDMPENHSKPGNKEDMIVKIDQSSKNNLSEILKDKKFLHFLEEISCSHKLYNIYGYLKLKNLIDQDSPFKNEYIQYITIEGSNFNDSSIESEILKIFWNYKQSKVLTFKYLLGIKLNTFNIDQIITVLKSISVDEFIQFVLLADATLAARILSQDFEVMNQFKDLPQQISFIIEDYSKLIERFNTPLQQKETSPLSTISGLLPPSIEKKFNKSFQLGEDFFSTLNNQQKLKVKNFLQIQSINKLMQLAPILPVDILDDLCLELPQMKSKRVKTATQNKVTVASMNAKRELIQYVKNS